MTRTSILGGESSTRGFLGGSMSRSRKIALGSAGAIAAVLTLTLQVIGAVVGVLLLSIAFLGTSGENSFAAKMVARARLRDAAKRGTDTYRPFEAQRWEELQQVTGRKEVREAVREMGAMRQMPTGADGMGWLDMESGHPGIAWHTPLGEAPYLSVCFSVTGQLRGIKSGAAVDSAGEAWGKFQATLGKLTSLANGVQTLTRILPPDSARHEAWVKSQLEPVPAERTGEGREALQANLARTGHLEAIRSYDQLLKLLSRGGSMVSRHYVVVTWRLDGAFETAAAAHGEGNDAWRHLMQAEIASVRRRLIEAKEGQVEVLTARQTAGVLRHMQHPDWPIDQASDVDPTSFGMAADPFEGAHHVHADGPDGQTKDWYHATGQAVADSIATGPRTVLWLLAVLTLMNAPIIRTISINRIVVPAGQAKRAARQDVTSDQSDQMRDKKKGRLVDDETKVRLNAAQRRRADLMPGSGHAGVEYLIHVTVSARTPEALRNARRLMTETFDTSLGIEGLEWFDSYQPAASGLTWPIARGIRAPKSTMADRFDRRTART